MNEEEMYVIKEGKKLRCGYTTGSCAAAAAKACAIMLEYKETISFVQIDTPSGITLNLEVEDCNVKDNEASCCIIKDGGDDPDVTDGIKIYALVKKTDGTDVLIDGGQGVGRIKKKGLFGEIGDAAINSTPRKMIRDELRKVSDSGYNVIVYVPQGEQVAKKTYNKNIGIEGGISIIGTKGIVYPMSEDALKKTIYLEIDSIFENCENQNIILVPGNYGENVVKSLKIEGSMVKVSNYIGDSILYAYNKGFKSITLVGHIGKFSKLSIGAFNTHSKICDIRIEAFVYYLALKGASLEVIKRVNSSITSEEALAICIKEGYQDIVLDMKKGCEKRIRKYLKDENYPVEVILYSMERGVFL